MKNEQTCLRLSFSMIHGSAIFTSLLYVVFRIEISHPFWLGGSINAVDPDPILAPSTVLVTPTFNLSRACIVVKTANFIVH